ncbi:MAG: prepilin-type N-terminal cleavage/methylation domain-containing protein, partial [bacterium]|nr:prepilin-type N-terminal cleavage/methylation domain-containing protein [bacterium]
MSDHSNHKGFTLVELIVSMGIMAIILSVVISSQSTYTDSAALSNLADEIGLTISQAQAYGIGVREFSPGTSDFTASYGLVFSLLESDFNKSYISFADRNSNKIYDGDWSCQTGDGLECLKKTDIPRGNYIESLCVVRSSGGDICTVGRADITFTRP